MSIDYGKVGAKIQYYRELQGIPQDELAESAAVSRVFMGYLERGERRPSMETFIAIVGALNVSSDDILADYLTPYRPSFYSVSMEVFSDCTKEEADFLIATLKSTKQILRKYKITE